MRRASLINAHRPDIQAMRAFAVLSVVLFHLWPGLVPGGFVGVDVFFVISGFLITGHLVRSLRLTGRIRLADFWARRAARILPAALLTLVATGVACVMVAPSSLWQQYGREAIAATLFAQNWRLAADAVDYLAQANSPSPFQQYWSLSVEEQFYLALPLLLVVVGAVTRRRGSLSPVTLTRLILAIVLVVSLSWSVVQTQSTGGVAYFSTATRAWEFAAGGLAATLPPPRRRPLAVGLGCVAVTAPLFVFASSTPFPGIAAALPVGGAVLLLRFGTSSVLTTLGDNGVVAHLGRISYALYLWHWPMIVLVPLWTKHPLTTAEGVGVLGAAVGLATASTLVFEERVRKIRILVARPRSVLLASGALLSAIVLCTGTGLARAESREVAAAAEAERTLDDPVAARCFGAAALIGSSSPCVNRDLAGTVIPSAATAADDDPNRASCWSNDTADVNVCRLGPTTGYTRHLLAVGDSHNAALISAYSAIATERGWRIDVTGHVACYLTTARQVAASAAGMERCDRWKAAASAYVLDHAADLDAVVVTHSSGNSPVLPRHGDDVHETTVSGLAEAWRPLVARGLPIIAVRDNPVARDDVVTCVAQQGDAASAACGSRRRDALRFDGSSEALARVGADRGRVIDLTDYYCDRVSCPAVIGGALVYRDATHLTGTFAATLGPFLGAAIEGALRELVPVAGD